MGKLGWSYPPGCSGPPEDQPQATDLRDNKTLRGHGRSQHGLMGKDADLDAEGQVVIVSAWWIENEVIECEFYCYATVCPDEEWTEDQEQIALELVIDTPPLGEWTGDEWEFKTPHITIRFDHEWEDVDVKIPLTQEIQDLHDEMQITAACDTLHCRIMDHPDVKAFQLAMSELNKDLDGIVNYQEDKDDR